VGVGAVSALAGAGAGRWCADIDFWLRGASSCACGSSCSGDSSCEGASSREGASPCEGVSSGTGAAVMDRAGQAGPCSMHSPS